MKALLKVLLVPTFLLVAASAWAQPTISSIIITGGGTAYGGGGPTAPGAGGTSAGAGFSGPHNMTPVVGVNNKHILIGVSGSTSAPRTASGVRPFRVAAGSAAVLQLYALVDGVKSTTHVNFIYYGALNITSVTGNLGLALSGGTTYSLFGGPFTSGGLGWPGTTSIYSGPSIHDFASGCLSTSQCNDTAPGVTYDCCVPQGAWNIDIRTVGGFGNAYLTYGATPATPTISSVSPASGNAM